MLKAKKYTKNNEFVLSLLILALFVFFSFSSPYFFKAGNLIQLLTQFVELGFITLGMSAAMISGGYDMSIGTLTSMLTVLIATLVGTNGLPVYIALPIVLIIALLCGTINGILCGYLKLAPMLATLGTMSFFTGVGMVLSKGNTVNCLVEDMYVFGQGKILGIVPVQFIIFLCTAIISIILFNRAKWGRRVYLIGTSPIVSKYSGIDCEKNTMLVYIYSSVMAFLCALILTSRMCSGRADVGDPMVLQSVSAAVFGGISIKGGAGNIIGALIGVVIFSLISNGMNLLDISIFIQQITIGVMLLGIISVRMLFKKG